MNLFYAIYGLAGLYSILMVLHHAWMVIRKRERVTSAMFGELDILIFTAFLIVSYGQTVNSLGSKIPDGTYTVNVGVQYPGEKFPFLMAADIHTNFDVEYEDEESWAGGWEHTTTEKTANMRYTLVALYVNGPDQKPVYMDKDIAPNSTITEEFGNKYVQISVGNLSAEDFGITPKDNWDAQSTSQKFWTVFPMACGAVGLLQMFLLDEERKGRISEWYKTVKS